MKYLFILIVIFISGLSNNKALGQEHPISKLEQRLIRGELSALFEIAKYFDSKKKVIDHLGYHIIQTNESAVAKRIVKENCVFTDSEIIISSDLTANDFLDFLNANRKSITFSKLADAFIITPLESRISKVDFREIAENKKIELQAKYSMLLTNEWVKEAKLDSFIKERNSKALLLIASELYKIRYRFNSNYSNRSEFIQLLQILMGHEIAVENERDELTWHIEKTYYPDASLNLLIYFAGNFSYFKWDEKSSTFKNDRIQVKSIGREEFLFQLLNSESDSIAVAAFIQLTRCNPAKVVELADEFERADIDKNRAIPIFPYRFLKQLVVLTDYCKQNNIDFEGSERLKLTVDKLDLDLSFKERRRLEDSIVNNLSLEEITAFEYWVAIKEQSWEITYSAGRILDIFYSRHWTEMLMSEKYLKLFLKKSYLFDQLGIIGICNNYLVKFTNNGDLGVKYLELIQTNDKDITNQIEKAKVFCKQMLKVPYDTLKVSDANRDYNISNVAEKIEAIKAIKNQRKLEDDLVKLLSKINYSQIGEALRKIESIEFKERIWDKYDFMERDFGFFLDENFDTLPTRTKFLSIYDKLSEFELYSYYLDLAGIDYKNKDNTLNYDKIFNLIKYNVVVAFVGGGGGKRDNEVYAIIKLLELTHKTTLGYPRKLCNSNGMYGCDSQDRVNEWMRFIIDRNLLKDQHNEPVSFHY